jgi:hypothetical protein
MGKRMRATAVAAVLAVFGGVLGAVPATLVTSAPAGAAITTEDLTTGATATQLAQSLAGDGVTVSNVSYSGADTAAGRFVGGAPSVGFDGGVVLSSGRVRSTTTEPTCDGDKGVEGPNQCDGNSTSYGTPGDEALTALSGVETNDAAALQFDFVPSFSTVQFKYVFSSDEYNQYANSSYNDVFAFFVNGANCAKVPGTEDTPVSINTINGGNPLGTNAQNPSLYRNNEFGGATIDTEADGLTTVLECNASVNPGVSNTMRLAIADGSDSSLDSNVFIQAGSLISGTVISGSLSDGENSGTTLTVSPTAPLVASATLSGANAATATGSVVYTAYFDSACTSSTGVTFTKPVVAGVPAPTDPVTAGVPGTYYWQVTYSGDAQNNPSSTTCGDLVVIVTGTPVEDLTLALAPASGSAEVGTTQTATATVTRDGVAQAGVPVTFTVTAGPNTGTTAEVTTDAAGLAVYSYSSSLTGTDTLQASAIDTGEVVRTSNSVTRSWTETPVAPLAVTLAPATSSGPVGSTFTATANVTRDGVPQEGVEVSFSVTSGPNADSGGTVVTDDGGNAEYSYTSEVVGTDVLVAQVVDGDTPVDSNSVSREWTPVATTDLTITSEGQPATVTAGASALRIITVTNPADGPVGDVSITFTLAPGTSLVRTTPSQGTCGPVVAGTVTCQIGTLAGGAGANVRFVVATPGTIPPGGTITTSATARSGDSTPVGPAESTTSLVAPTPGSASGYVPPGGTLTTGGDATPGNDTVASLTLPNSGEGAVVNLTSVPCAPGVCFGKTVTFNDFPGYDDPTKPIKFETLYDKSVRGTGLLSQMYVLKENQTQYAFVPPCSKPGEKKLLALVRYLGGLLVGGHSGIAVPSPCVDKKNVLKNGDLRILTLFTSGDPSVRRR